jgi:hypothetical protein
MDSAIKKTKKLSIFNLKKDSETLLSMENVPAGNIEKWKRCSFGSQDSANSGTNDINPTPEVATESNQPVTDFFSNPVEQKIIWEWTGGYNFDQRTWGWGHTPRLCKEMSDSLGDYSQAGWRIISSAPNVRNVQTGTCQGRDIVIEK